MMKKNARKRLNWRLLKLLKTTKRAIKIIMTDFEESNHQKRTRNVRDIKKIQIFLKLVENITKSEEAAALISSYH